MKTTFAELHFHTKETSMCGEVSASVSIPKYKAFGYDLVVVTDHYNREYFYDYYAKTLSWEKAVDNWLLGYRTAKKAGDACGLKVLLGAEFRFDTSSNDYLVYGMTEEMFYSYPCLWELGEEKFSSFARNHGLFFAQAHPYRKGVVRCDPSLLMGVEVFNAHPHHEDRNELAQEFCRENSLIPICGSDYHQPEALCGCGMKFHGNVDNINELVNKLFAGEYDMQYGKES